MKNLRIFLMGAAGWLLATATWAAGRAPGDGAANAAVSSARLPPGFHLSLFTAQTPEARSLTLGDDGTVYVGTRNEGKIYAARDADGDGSADQVTVVATGLSLPNGVAFKDGSLYVAETRRILRYDRIGQNLAHPPQPVVVYDGLPEEQHHGSRYLRVGPDGKLYVGIGVPCNICEPSANLFGTLARLDTDGSHFEILARGIRNTVGFDWQPGTHALYFTDNGRDWMGDDLPPEELNRFDQPGQHFGYPYCHAGTVSDPQYGSRHACSEFSPPVWRFQAHVAPLGARFYGGTQFPAEYRGQLFVAQHGSWNRSAAVGYRVVAVRLEQQGRAVSDSVFIDGWLANNGLALARPVDLLPMPDGSLLVSDDQNGAIYRVVYRP